MKSKLKIFIVLGLVALCGYGVGRAQDQSDWTSQVKSAALGEDGGEKLADAYIRAAGNPELTKSALKLAFVWEPRSKPLETTLSAMQIAQNQKLIEQNAEIIQLLRGMQK